MDRWSRCRWKIRKFPSCSGGGPWLSAERNNVSSSSILINNTIPTTDQHHLQHHRGYNHKRQTHLGQAKEWNGAYQETRPNELGELSVVCANPSEDQQQYSVQPLQGIIVPRGSRAKATDTRLKTWSEVVFAMWGDPSVVNISRDHPRPGLAVSSAQHIIITATVSDTLLDTYEGTPAAGEEVYNEESCWRIISWVKVVSEFIKQPICSIW